ncbi:MAG: choice-of-anchor Q domain-containing protein [Actinomycetota bacterium]
MRNSNLPPHADPDVLTRFHEELAQAAAMTGLAPPSPALWPRFAGYYQGLARLPRKARRALQRRWRRSLGGLAVLWALGQAPALAATISVDGTTCTLVDAITAANNDTASGNCPAGSGADTIELNSGSTHTLTTVNNDTNGPTGLPVITSEITIVGLSSITRDSSAPEFRILAVGPTGNLTLLGTEVSGGAAFSGAGICNFGTLITVGVAVLGNTATDGGGGIYNDGTMTLNSSLVASNTSVKRGGGIANYGALTLTDSTISFNTAGYGRGGGIASHGPVTLDASTVSGNSAGASGGGVYSIGDTLTVTNSMVSGNKGGASGGGISSSSLCFLGEDGCAFPSTLTLTNSTVSGNTAGIFGGGVSNLASVDLLTLTNSTVSGNTAAFNGGGVDNIGTLTLTNSTVFGNTTASGGGVTNLGTVTLTNSTISGNTAADRGGAVDNIGGTVMLTNTTVSGNSSGRVAGGLFNIGTVTLVQSLLSGNTAPVNGPEAYSVAGGQSGGGTVTADGLNVIGHDGSPGIAGFTLGASDVVPADPLAAILDPTLAYNGGATRTHALVFGSPAVDAVLGTACGSSTDQRGAPRAQDGDGDTVADCDIGAVERGQVPVQVSLNSTRLDCRTAACRVPATCNLTEAECTNEVEVTVRTRPRQNSEGTATKAARLIRFAAGVANIPPGGSGAVTLRLTKQGKRLVRATKKRRLKGVLGIREIATAVSVSNTPFTISRTDVTIRLKRRK